MKQIALILLLLLSCSRIIYSQEINLSGFVIDEQLNPVPSAVVTLNIGENILSTTTTDEDGSFMLISKQASEVILKISHISYEILSIPVTLLRDTSINVCLRLESYDLQATTVVATRPALEFKNGNLIVNVNQVPGSKTGDLAKLLGRMPGVTASSSEGITLNGKNATIYVDGRKQTLTTATSLSLLRSLPISSVDKVELITNNTGEYDAAEGVAIINIISNKQRFDGYYFTIGGEGRFYESSDIDGGGNVFYMFKKNKILFNSSFSYNNGYTWRNRIDSTIHKTATIMQDATYRVRTDIFTGNANLDWEVRKGHNLNFNFFFYDDFSKTYSEQYTKRYKNQEINNYNLLTHKKGNDDLWSGFLQYSSPDSLSSQYKVSYSIVYGGVRSNNDYYKKDMYDNENWYMSSDANMIAYRQTIKLDYTQFIKEKVRLMFGTKIDLGNLTDYLLYKEIESNYPNSEFKGQEDIYSGFMQFRYNLNKNWSIISSLRVEHTDYNINYKSENSVIERSFTNFFPYLHLSYTSESKNYNGVFAFLTSIVRPNYNNMIPGIRYSDDYYVSIGNPDLKPSTSYGFVLDQYFYRYIYLTLRYEVISNIIGEVMGSVNEEVTELRYENYADNKRFYTSVNIPFNFFDEKLSGRLSGNATYNTLVNPKNGYVIPLNRNNYWIYGITAVANYQISDRFGINVFGNYRGAYRTPQFDFRHKWSVDIGLSYSFLEDDRVVLALDVEDIFNSFNNNFTSYYGNSIKNIENLVNTRLIKLSFLLKFNNGEKIRNRAKSNQSDISRFSNL